LVNGAEASNLALKSFAIGGVFIGGGIAPKILSAMQGGFIQAFKAKGRFHSLLNTVSVKVSLNPRTPFQRTRFLGRIRNHLCPRGCANKRARAHDWQGGFGGVP